MTNMDSYFITIIPPKNIIDIVDKYRNKYSLYSSYKIVPHVTISPPFYLEKLSEKEITFLLQKDIKNLQTTNLIFDSIKYFPNGDDKNVAYFAPNTDSINLIKIIFVVVNNILKGNVKAVYDNYNFDNLRCHPHMTIASKIPDKKFEEIKKELSKVNENLFFEVGSVYLYKKKDKTSEWNEVSEIKFRK